MRNEAGNITPLVNEIAATLCDCDFEIVVVDAGSTDASEAELRSLMTERPWLRQIRRKRSCGQSAAIHTGVTMARAPISAQNAPAAKSGRAHEARAGSSIRASPILLPIRSISGDLAAMPAIIDTGPLVAFFDRAERHHAWAVSCVEELGAPLLICEPVLTEAMYLLARYSQARGPLLELLEDGALSIAFRVEENVAALRRLLQKYRDRPMSLADACVVRMAEIHDRHDVLTLDSAFSVYRKHGRVPLSLIQPETR